MTARLGCSSQLHILPLSNRARYYVKKRVHFRHRNFKMAPIDDGSATLQLLQEPTPFVLQLAVGDRNPLDGDVTAKFGTIEPVAARLCVRPNDGEIAVDGGAGRLT